MNGDLNVELVCNAQTLIDRGGCCAPVLMQFQPERARPDLLTQRLRQRRVPLAEEAEIERKRLGSFVHTPDIPRPWGTCRRIGAGGRPCTSADQSRDAGIERFRNLV